ncbi:cytochrome b561 domain-containing protein At2g30890-like [Juglans microcarpa x Juglans regia]|uniref:cytochrome b561 domain-containing protein At2g30890-like n=1 Tax=Juglans microcarpa x Juglans regia TaxID=2249226 RepID=UPI001B7E9C71|nr:cytochrome b561 domain-containing protein At2g30890-like [Juglans microcarpa x Juglans regia]
MLLLQKLGCFVILASIFILALPVVCSSQEPAESASKKDHLDKLSPKFLFEITLHGFLLWASMGFLMPVGILIIRMSNREESGRRLRILFYVHAILQILVVLLATAGAVLSIKNFNNSFNNYHQRIGVALYGIIWLQPLLGIVRPQRGSKGRSVWFFVHWLVGTAISLLGILNIYSGLQAYHEKTSRSIRLWIIIFTAEMSFIAFLYLLQDKWLDMQKQGVIMASEPIRPTEKEVSPRDIEKELMIKSC